MELEDIVSKYPPKQIMLVPIAIIILALISLGATYLATGSPVKLGIEFTGGTLVTVPSAESEEKVAEQFDSYPLVDTRNIGGRYLLQFGPMSDSDYSGLVTLANANFDLLKKNRNVCFEFDTDTIAVPAGTSCGWTMRYRSVIGYGIADFVEDPGGKRAALDVIMRQYAERTHEYSDETLRKTAVIKVEIREISGKKSGY